MNKSELIEFLKSELRLQVESYTSYSGEEVVAVTLLIGDEIISKDECIVDVDGGF
jgi:hypothetical protein